MSAPLPDWIAAVMRGCRSLALMNSNTTSAPSAFDASGACRFSSTSASGMKSTQRTTWTLVPWANAGARRAARIPATPAAFRNVLRSIASSPAECSALVDLLQLALGPLHGILGLRALDGLREHVHHDVLRVRLGGLGRRRPGVAEHPGLSRRLPEHLQRAVDPGPHRVLLPHLGGAHAVALVDLEPSLVVLLVVEPLDEVLRQLLVLRVLHDRVLEGHVEGELACGALGQERRVLDVLDERLAPLVLDLFLLTLGYDVDGRAVQRRGNLARMERTVVESIVPGNPTLVARVLPVGLHDLNRLNGALGVDRDLLAGPVDLGAAEAPEQRIGERRRVSGAVAEGLPDGLALGLELLANLAPFVPGLRELLDADFRVPRASVGDGVADDAVGYGQPLAVHFRRDVEDVVVALLRLPDRLGHVRHVHEGAGIEVRPVVEHHNDVGAGAGLDRGGDARLQVVEVDELEQIGRAHVELQSQF